MHRTNHQEKIHVRTVGVISVACTAQLEAITVGVRASAVNYDADDRIGRVITAVIKNVRYT